MISPPAFTPQYDVELRTTPAPPLLGQLAQPLPQFPVMIFGGFALEASPGNADQPTGATLR
jgi:hypothetical protein